MSTPSNEVPESGKALDKDDVINILEEKNEDEKPLELDKKPNGEVETEEEREPEEDELEEIEKELEEPQEEEDLELVTPVRRKEVLAKYPNFFKEFPYYEKATYRDRQFSEVFPTPADARVAAEKAEILDSFESQIVGKGDITAVLEAIKNENQESFNRVADDYLGALKKVDNNAWQHVISSVIEDAMLAMVREARNMDKETGGALEGAAHLMNQFFFQRQQFVPRQKLSKQVDNRENQKEQELIQREQQIFRNQFETVREDLQTRADNSIKATLNEYIDPKQSMTEYVRKAAINDAMQMLTDQLERDVYLGQVLDKLWERAFRDGMSRPSQDKIKSAYLARAKTLLPPVIKKARNEALRGLGKRVRDDSEEESPSTSRPVSRSSGGDNHGPIKSAKDIPRGMSTLDFLNRRG